MIRENDYALAAQGDEAARLRVNAAVRAYEESDRIPKTGDKIPACEEGYIFPFLAWSAFTFVMLAFSAAVFVKLVIFFVAAL
jgi:hypothetical protein